MSHITTAIARTFLSLHLPEELVDKILKDVYEDIRKLVMLQIKVRKFYASVWYCPSDNLISMCREPGSIQTGTEIGTFNSEKRITQVKYIEPWMLWQNYQEYRSFVYKERIPIRNYLLADYHVEKSWKYEAVCSRGCSRCKESFPCTNAFIQKFPGTRWSSRNLSSKIYGLWSGKYYGNEEIIDFVP